MTQKAVLKKEQLELGRASDAVNELSFNLVKGPSAMANNQLRQNRKHYTESLEFSSVTGIGITPSL